MRVAMMTREYPPEVYGGAGVHVTELVANLRPLCEVDVLCMGADRDTARAFRPDPELGADANPAIQTLSAGLRMSVAAEGADLVHSHTWYTGLAGHLAGQLYGIPHVVSAHSLEPSRPWKAEQLGGGYRVSSWSERTAFAGADAVVAVSARMKDEILRVYPEIDPDRIHVILNGIDTSVWSPVETFAGEGSVLRRNGVDPDRPIVAFVGRITRQKGVPHLVRAARDFHPDAQLVLCAGAPDTPEIAAEMESLVAELQSTRDGVFWLRDMLPREEVIEILSAATVFACPSVYEPLGIVNLEAMACDTAVVASDVGGIPEVVVDGETGTLVHYDASATDAFEAGLAAAVNDLVADPGKAARMGLAGKERARTRFSWEAIAEQTHRMYASLL
ncbi:MULTISPECIES: glycogen synthase [Dietzia]|uniref:Glycogen synthase n=2 Tax=Dietzia maris TaxID=37915 RepID=A0AAE4QVL5_9ACTN|nr:MULTISPECIES: glycogen synthase [Dietzia]MBB0991718.1 glycogen synthase [Dietzia sp. SLG510A3-30A2]MBB0993004.1 glycogen synthase [Dietzia sp. SLG510A3-40A3]MBB1009965.1 glycogen synthase [Dietzia sp. SLG510A3-3B2-2]MBB1018294.1 glycogen synthase [Dietzia sp. DQ11-71]ODQ94748.1 glycosyl transferase family 1 [Dietzia alimentaria]